MLIVTVMYPETEGAWFDLDYYLGTHLSMVAERWGSMGLTGARVLQGNSGLDPDTPPPYRIMVVADFESREAFEKAAAAHGEEIFGDVPNFTDITPVVQLSDVVAG